MRLTVALGEMLNFFVICEGDHVALEYCIPLHPCIMFLNIQLSLPTKKYLSLIINRVVYYVDVCLCNAVNRASLPSCTKNK